MTDKSVLVVDDEPDIRQLLQEILEDEGHQVIAVADAAAARQALAEHRPDLVLLDIWMPDEDGISLLKSWKESGDLVFPVIMISGHGTIETAVEATRVGAVDFIEKPVSLAKLLLTVEKAFQTAQNNSSAVLPPHLPPPFLCGVSQGVVRLKEQLPTLSGNDVNVLLFGPEGSGREQFARLLSIGAITTDASGGQIEDVARFVRLRCESLSASSYQRELFGSEVNGVVSRGYLESAHNGTLFLDNIEQLPVAACSSLLEAIQQKSFTRVGGSHTQEFDARLVSSSRHPLDDLLSRRAFNAELAKCLAGRQLQFYALRDRLEDIPALLENLVQWLMETEGFSYRHFTVAAQNRLRNLEWPGNLPELQNLVQRALILGGSSEIDVAEIEELLGISNAHESTNSLIALRHDLPLREARAQFERQYLLRCLQNSSGNIGELAKHVGMERTHLYRKLRSLDIDLDKVRE